MITLADLRARSTLPSWQEAVAIVQELFHATAAGGSTLRLPDIEHIALSPEGAIIALPGSSIPPDPVRHLAVLLDVLLEDVTAPPELKDIVQRNCADPPEARSIDELVNALAFFERPGRREDIGRLVARALEAGEQTRADDELRRLKARAIEAEKQGQPVLADVAVPPRRVAVMPLAAAALLLLAGVGGAVWWMAQSRSSSTSRAASTEVTPSAQTGNTSSGNTPTGNTGAAPVAKPASFLGRVGDAVRAAFTSSAAEPAVIPPPPPAPPPAPAPVHRLRRQLSARAAAGPAPNASADAEEAATDPVSIITTELGGHAIEPDIPTDAAAGSAGDALYTAGDVSVLPPSIVRPVIPPPPAANAPPESVALFDLVIDRRGRVEQVRIASAPTRFHERMLLSHIKAWSFQPAMKDGRPVRYRLRVLLTV
jgi:hypothetical protein